MSFNIHIIRTSDFIRLNTKGGLDLDASRQALKELARVCVERGIDCALLDMRNIQTPAMTMSDLYQLALTFKETGFRKHHRLALLHRYRAGERAEFFAICASDQGWNVRAFEDYEHAVEWFGVALPADE